MIKKTMFALLAVSMVVTSCSDDDDNNGSTNLEMLTLNLNGLEALGDDFVYEGWIIVDGSPVSTGRFSSVTFPQNFAIDGTQLANASTFVLSIEPADDPDPSPAATKILSGDFSGETATVNSNMQVADLSTSTGNYILATPTDGANDTNEFSGVWFLDNSSGSAVTGLDLPTLQSGWVYEGWAVINGTPISTGTFTDEGIADDNAATSPYKGDAGNGPNYPGEDFLQNAPDGFTFPTDLREMTIVISVEPSPDNSASPFTLKPLAHMVPANAVDHTTIAMGAGPVIVLAGSVTR